MCGSYPSRPKQIERIEQYTDVNFKTINKYQTDIRNMLSKIYIPIILKYIEDEYYFKIIFNIKKRFLQLFINENNKFDEKMIFLFMNMDLNNMTELMQNNYMKLSKTLYDKFIVHTNKIPLTENDIVKLLPDFIINNTCKYHLEFLEDDLIYIMYIFVYCVMVFKLCYFK